MYCHSHCRSSCGYRQGLQLCSYTLLLYMALTQLQLIMSNRAGGATGLASRTGMMISSPSFSPSFLFHPNLVMSTAGGSGRSADFQSSICRWALRPWRCTLHSVGGSVFSAGGFLHFRYKSYLATFRDADLLRLYRARKKNPHCLCDLQISCSLVSNEVKQDSAQGMRPNHVMIKCSNIC